MKIFDESAAWRSQIGDETLLRWSDEIVIADVESLASVNWPMSKVIAVTDKIEAKDLVAVALATGVRHVIQVSNPRFDHAVNLAAQMIADPFSFNERPVESFFNFRLTGVEGFHLQKFTYRNSKEKPRVLAELQEHVRSIPGSRTISDAVQVIADELFTNSVFNAPVDKSRKGRFAKLQRNLLVELDSSHSASLFVAYDGKALLIGCEDTYGSIDPMYVIRRISGCYQQGVASVINADAPGGAGIGCYMMLEQSSSYFVCVTPMKKTVVFSVLLLGLPAKLALSVPKNLHIIPAEEM